MKDIDFDELDRAVNSVINNTGAPLNSDSSSQSNNPSIEARSVDAKPSMPMHPSILARRSNGRFMDMVPLSASTRNNVSSPVRVARQGVDIVPQAVNPNPVTSNAASESESFESSQVSAEQPSNTWPDPIDSQSVNQGVEIVSEDQEDADIDQINADIENTLNPKNDDALESPFISGTKVEKRPLNALSENGLDFSSLEEGYSPTPSQPETTNSIDTGSFNTNMPLPAELGDDLLSIESGNATTTAVAPIETAEIEPVSAPAVNQVVSSPVTNPANDSIVQQYQEQPSSGDQTNAAIYDTNTYHKAVLKSSKGKSGWLWIVWILVLIAAGAGVGAAVFFLMPGF